MPVQHADLWLFMFISLLKSFLCVHSYYFRCVCRLFIHNRRVVYALWTALDDFGFWGLQPSTTPCSSIPWLGGCYKFWIIRPFIFSLLGLTLLSYSFTPTLGMGMTGNGVGFDWVFIGSFPVEWYGMMGDIWEMLKSWGLKSCWPLAKEHILFQADPCRLYVILNKKKKTYWNFHAIHRVYYIQSYDPLPGHITNMKMWSISHKHISGHPSPLHGWQ